jgi:two-component system, NtrC family, sensor kinase
MRRGAKPAKAKVKAKRPAPTKSRKNEGSSDRQLEKRLEEALKREAEALEQQTATSEILRVISSSPTDIEPVFDTIVRRAARLCEAYDAAVLLRDGDRLHVGAHYGPIPVDFVSRAIDRDWVTGRAVVEGKPVQVRDLSEAGQEFPGGQILAFRLSHKALLAVPLLREREAIGAITIRRTEARSFSEKHVALLQTFADQAVIAIENVRLFNETKEALERQAATAEILRVISSSPTDVQPVFDAIVLNASRLCGGDYAIVIRYDGGMMHLGAQHNPRPGVAEPVAQLFPRAPARESSLGRAILDRSLVHIPDVVEDPQYDLDIIRAARLRGVLSMPMLRDGKVIGVISVSRETPGLFAPSQIALLQTFADQAVVAIENVRLFTELQDQNLALTRAHAQVSEALERQTATSEILRVISSSPTDVQPVFDTIVRNAVVLCEALFGAVFHFDGDMIHLVAHHNFTPEVLELLSHLYPMRPSREQATGRVILSGTLVHLHDVLADPEYRQEVAASGGWRSMLAVPMSREGTAVGVIWVARAAAGPFPDNEVALLQTFADQAVIAIENVRLFKELQARTQELTRSVDQLTALGEVGQAVSSTLDLETVLTTIVSRAVQLSGSYEGIVYEFDEATQTFHARATHQITPEHLEALRRTPVRLGEGAVGRAGVIREPVQVADIEEEWQLVAPQVRALHAREGMRSLLAVPLVREDRLFGGLVILRRERGAFPPEVVAMLQTFAAQSVLAIQNARLFREIADKSRQLEVASQHKSEFLANMSHELRTPLNAIIGFSEVLTEHMFGELNEKQEEYLKDIHASGQHLLSLINDILDLSKIEAGRMELEVADFDLPAAIDNALTLVRERAGRRGIALHQAVDERLGAIRADERKLKQVLLNLLSNAIKFTPEGGRIEVRALPVDGSVEVSVTDTGVGIAPEDQEAVFEEFRQVGGADKKAEGTGLGLALSRKFVELHGGRIWVTSQVGVGSTFAFTLPLTIGQRRQTG